MGLGTNANMKNFAGANVNLAVAGVVPTKFTSNS